MGQSIAGYDGSLRDPHGAGFAASTSARASPARSEPAYSASDAVSSSVPPAECPIDHSSMRKQRLGKDSPLNPLNRMPELTQLRSEGQQTVLPTERTVSSIPRRRASSSSESACPVAHAPATAAPDAEPPNWVYPSPQQFHNALVRKGKGAPEESVEMMVQIHNWLNESAWAEVRRWEESRTPGQTPELARFEGRPDDLSPKARWNLLLGRFFPESYNTEPPFDRHDWQVARSDGSLHRYVIDYYSAGSTPEGEPVFFLDVRPALDSPSAVFCRLSEWSRLKRERLFGAGQAEPATA